MAEKIAWGCVADDFTGASDAASFFAEGGLQTALYNGVPDQLTAAGQAVVIALKTRTQEKKMAVNETLAAVRWLKAQGARQIYIKYCSTFDSTPQGNIGPVLDALLAEYHQPYTILCPALPVNGRIVRHGRLYVNGVLLADSPMKDHPLTPMWDSEIARLMKPQSIYECMNLTEEELKLPKEGISMKIKDFRKDHHHFYVIPDYVKNDDGERIVDLFGSLPILSGGSGLVKHLALRQTDGGRKRCAAATETDGPGVILAGSCSEMTRSQIAYAQAHCIASIKIEPLVLMNQECGAEMLWDFLQEQRGNHILFYSSDVPDQVKRIQQAGKGQVADFLETLMAELAVRAMKAGYVKIIVAGGETSGAVTRALGFNSYVIGESVAPGVPVMIPQENKRMRLVLKSGNFGQPDFFIRALRIGGIHL